eukprot:Hpha_TRINITY_DN3238_c0_g1::TRINITY_DN3238_c0_g1_i1::g.185818::m.185818
MRGLLAAAVLLQVCSAAVDVIGYYGNSGNAVSDIPTISGVHENYNIIIITFASLDTSGNVTLDIQGPYQKNLPGLASAIAEWKQGKDPFGRERKALVSIGGQNGRWPSGITAGAIEAGLGSFMKEFNLDGLDIDLEGSAVSAATSLVPVIKSLTSQGKIVTAAVEAAQGPLDGYKNILSLCTWVHPQFYNNPPNAVTTPYIPTDSEWPSPWTVSDWQQEHDGLAFWAAVMNAIEKADGLTDPQRGMLIPASASAAGSQNHYDIAKLATQVKFANITHVGTWAIAYDNQQGWTFAKAIGGLNA